jgi:trimeric autotransporter adhesin
MNSISLRIVLAALFLGQIAASAFANSGIISTYVGPELPLNGASATTQSIDSPASIAPDGAGGFYFTSSQNRVYRVKSDGSITLIAGTSGFGFSGDGGQATSAKLGGPHGIAVDSYGNIYIADTYNNRIRRITSNGVISTFAGTGIAGFSGDGGPAAAAKLNTPFGLAIDSFGNLYIADVGNQRIRRITSAGVISTFAGIGTVGFSGDTDSATSAKLNFPYGVSADSSGNIYIADTANNRIRKINSAGIINTVAGNGSSGYSGDGNQATLAKIFYPYDVSADSFGNFFIVDSGNYRIRMVTSAGVISTFAGNGTQGYGGDGGQATAALLDGVRSVVADSSTIYIADSNNHRIRKVAPSGLISTVAGQSGFSGDAGYAANAMISSPSGVASDSNGNLYVADTSNHRVRRVSGAGIISTIAGNGIAGYSGDGGQAVSAKLNTPDGLAVDSSGNIYVADSYNHRIRKITSDGVISTFAGTGAFGYSGDGGQATAAQLYYPHDVAVDVFGNLYIADTNNHRIRKVTSSGIISTVAGTGTAGYSADGVAATTAKLNAPTGLAVDSSGNIYIADTYNHRIRKVTSDGVINTVAGIGTAGYSGDSTAATLAKLNFPYGVALDSSANLYIADLGNNAIRLVAASTSIISTIAGNGVPGFSGDGSPSIEAQLDSPYTVEIDSSGNVFIADSANQRIRKIASSNSLEIYFAQVAVGGGWTTSFTLANAGSTAVTGTLMLMAQDGNPLSVSTSTFGTGSSFPVDLAPGGTLFLPVNPVNAGDAPKSGWAKVTATGGSLTGVATYQYSSGQTLQSATGVLSTEPMQYAMIPVDNNESQSLSTAYAIGNPTYRDIVVKICLVDSNGNVVDDTVSKTLTPGQQISNYIGQDFINRATFQGSVVLRAQGGGLFVAIALIQKQQDFTVIPVIPGKASTIPD